VNRDGSVRVYPPAVVVAAGTARSAGRVALDLGEGLRSLAQGTAAFLPTAGAAFARMHAEWLRELTRLGVSVSELGDSAEAAAGDYVRTDLGVLAGSAGSAGQPVAAVSPAGGG
jgi:hypothetical protein